MTRRLKNHSSRHLSLEATATTRSAGSNPDGSTATGLSEANAFVIEIPKHPAPLSPHANTSEDLELHSEETSQPACHRPLQ